MSSEKYDAGQEDRKKRERNGRKVGKLETGKTQFTQTINQFKSPSLNNAQSENFHQDVC